MNNSKNYSKPKSSNEIQDIIRRFSETPEVKNIAKSVDPHALKKAAEHQDPEVIRAVVNQLLASEDGKQLARKVKSAMEHG